MGKKYKHLNFIDRCHISAMNMKGMPQKEIAEKINVSPSTISRELRRNWLPDYDCYDSTYASFIAQERIRRKKKSHRFNQTIVDFHFRWS